MLLAVHRGASVNGATGIVRSEDGGEHWSVAAALPSGTGAPGPVVIGAAPTTTVYAVTTVAA